MARKQSARQKLRDYFKENVGKVLDTRDLREVAGISDYQRRIRELRREEGMDIWSHNDTEDLRPGQYLLKDLEPIPTFSKGISAAQRAKILARNGFTCQICGVGAGERDPVDPSRGVRLHVDHIVPLSEGGSNDDDNLRVTCSACNEGRSNLHVPVSQRAINLLQVIRRAPRDVQREVYGFLKRKFDTAE